MVERINHYFSSFNNKMIGRCTNVPAVKAVDERVDVPAEIRRAAVYSPPLLELSALP